VSAVKVTQIRGTIGQSRAHAGTLRALGLGRIGKTAEHKRSPELEGKLRHVAHLVTVTPIDETTEN
jgi:large subunit ribosomal protein L30